MFFTGKERDSETGLDYFGARYFSGVHGRFTSPDPTFMTKARISDPQQWNVYSYVRNHPLKHIDPDGRELKLVISPGTLPGNVASGTAKFMTQKLRNAGLKNVTYELKSGSPNSFAAQLLPSGHSVVVELRPSRAGDPELKPNDGGRNWGGQAAVNTSLVTSRTKAARVNDFETPG
ncbi:MAG: RHS repeat-associated core domain-containing protein [Bryobacterales bacterium]|nr:RHS repeat-associated core domain-containing protein [Bryobacterales bacterium]